MKQLVLVISSFYGFLSVTLGAIGTHMLAKNLSSKSLWDFEVGMRYMMFHAIILFVLGYQWSFESNVEKIIVIFFCIGVLLFSFSIFFLSTQDFTKLQVSFLGPITPLGGTLLILGWCLLIWHSVSKISF